VGSLRTLQKPWRPPGRFEVFQTIRGTWVCLDWESVPSNEQERLTEILQRLPESQSFYKKIEDIPQWHDTVVCCVWVSTYWKYDGPIGSKKKHWQLTYALKEARDGKS